MYDVDRFFSFLGYGRGNQTYECAGLPAITGFFRGVPEELDALLSLTPFERVTDTFCVSVADFSQNSGATYLDAAVIIPVRFGEVVGATYYFEFEDKHGSVAGGRELWGYPKRFAKVELSRDEHRAVGRVSNEGETVFELELDFDDAPDSEPWASTPLYPHLQVRAVPQFDGPSFQHFDILSRDTSQDYRLLEQRAARARVTFGPQISVAGTPLTVAESLGGRLTVGDYKSTSANGVPTLVASLV